MNAKKRLLEYLKHKDIGQTRLEQRCGISTGYISNNTSVLYVYLDDYQIDIIGLTLCA